MPTNHVFLHGGCRVPNTPFPHAAWHDTWIPTNNQLLHQYQADNKLHLHTSLPNNQAMLASTDYPQTNVGAWAMVANN
jgi:hypothetical protein